jgi:hypothetical protein
MKPTLLIVAVLAFGLAGCAERKAQEKARQDAEAKARADAARKEMEALPKTFQTPDYFKKNEPAKPEQPAEPKK